MFGRTALYRWLQLKTRKNAYEILPFMLHRKLDTLLRKKVLKLPHEDWWYGNLKQKGSRKKKYVICRYAYPEFALFAAAIQFAFTANYFRKKGYIPVIDLERVEDFKENELGKMDLWSCAFEQSVKPNEIPEGYWVYVDTIDSPHAFNNRDCLDLNEVGDDHWIHTRDKDWRAYYKKANEFVSSTWIFRDELKKNWQRQVGSRLEESDVVLGVALREEFSGSLNASRFGEDKAIYDQHPSVPEVDETLLLVEKYMKLWKCSKIFLSTEYWQSVEQFQNYFGAENVLCVDRRFRIERSWTKDLTMLHKGNENELVHTERFGAEYMRERFSAYATEIWGLSNCDYLIAAKCSGAIAALTFNAGEYKDICILSDTNHIARY